MKLVLYHHLNLVSLTGRKIEWFFVWEYRFLLWASPPPGLCHPLSCAPLTSTLCAGVLMPSICLWLVSIFWLYIWKFQLFYCSTYFFENFIHIFYYICPQLLDSSPLLYPVDSFIFFLCLVKTSNSKKETNKTKTKHTRKWFVSAGYCAWDLPWPVVAIYIQSYRTEKNIFPL